MSFSNKSDVLYKVIGHIGMITLLVLAYTLWLERSTTYDSSLYSFILITRDTVYTPHDRYLNYLWQWIPLLSLKFGISLATFMKIMSVAPILFLYAIYIFIAHILKNTLGGVYLIMILVVLIRYKFYSAIPEVYIGMAFVGLMVGYLTSRYVREGDMPFKSQIAWGIIILCLNYLGHPLMFYPMITVIGLDYLYLGQWKSRLHIILVIVAVILFLIKYLHGTSSFHEGPVINNFFASLSGGGFWDLYSLNIFGQYVKTQWAFPLAIVGLMLLLLLKNRKFLFVGGLVLAAVIWVVFVAHLGAFLEKPFLFMIEGYYILLGPILFLPILYVQIESRRANNMAALVMLSLMVFGSYRVYSVRPFFTERIADMYDKIEYGRQQGLRNVIAPSGDQMWDKHWNLWAVPFESLMLSSLKYDGESSVLLIDSYPKQAYLEQPFEMMIGMKKDSLKDIQTPYFNFDRRPFVILK